MSTTLISTATTRNGESDAYLDGFTEGLQDAASEPYIITEARAEWTDEYTSVDYALGYRAGLAFDAMVQPTYRV
ncbi:hypothetical protein [Streptomyces sp. NPDC001404]|uniref:hypothetical protein n=1 Tax=Streptomyces sp. NPDC001404 TaxID=3364571 RepID=UPI003676FDEF